MTLTSSLSVLDSQSAGWGSLKLPFKPTHHHGDAYSTLARYGCGLDRLIIWMKVMTWDTTHDICWHFENGQQLPLHLTLWPQRVWASDNIMWSFGGELTQASMPDALANALTLTVHLFSTQQLMKEHGEIVRVWYGWNNCQCHHIIEYPQPEQN